MINKSSFIDLYNPITLETVGKYNLNNYNTIDKLNLESSEEDCKLDTFEAIARSFGAVCYKLSSPPSGGVIGALQSAEQFRRDMVHKREVEKLQRDKLAKEIQTLVDRL